MVADLEHTIELEGAEVLRSFSAQRRIDLQLFYQECLINIIRHSGATRAQTRLWSEDGNIHLTITDDGSGLDGPAPASLKRRARLLGATLESGRAEPHGLRIRLRMKIREPRFFG